MHMENQPSQGKHGICRNSVKRPVVSVKNPDGADIEDGQQGGEKEPYCFVLVAGHTCHTPAYSL